jgi:hypothetical protein
MSKQVQPRIFCNSGLHESSQDTWNEISSKPPKQKIDNAHIGCKLSVYRTRSAGQGKRCMETENRDPMPAMLQGHREIRYGCNSGP